MTRRHVLKLAAVAAGGIALRGGSAVAAEEKPKDTEFRLEAVGPDLFASPPEPLLPFAPTMDLRAFLLRRDQGNLLVYSAKAFDARTSAVQDLGGVTRQYLNHWHEAMFASDRVGATLYSHEAERELVAEKTRLGETFSDRHMVGDDFELIPTPGHTIGVTTFLWSSGKYRYLFTSDQVSVRDSEWVATVLPANPRYPRLQPSDRDAYIQSLELIRELEFDVLVPWMAPRGKPYYAMTDKSDTQRRIDAIIKRLRRGENH